MDPCSQQQPDTVIISMLAHKNKSVWPYLYDKYASMMYGIIFNMTGDEAMAGEILTEIFWELKTKELLAQVRAALCHTLVRHTQKLTIRYLHVRGLSPISIQSVSGDYPIISSLYFELNNLNELESHSELSKQEILRDLRAEFNHFRHQARQDSF